MEFKRAQLARMTLTSVLVIPLLLTRMGGASAAGAEMKTSAGKAQGVQLEYLDRGLVAASTSEDVFLSWRLLANEVTGYSETGLTGANFNVVTNTQPK